MKKVMIFSTMLLISATLTAQELKNQSDSLSYAVGILWGQNIKQQGLTDIDPTILGQAIGVVLNGAEEQLDLKTANQLVKDHIGAKREAEKMKNKLEGEAFLKENAERGGVITLPSGLQYEIMKAGTGQVPTDRDKVSVHYHGTLINGDVFDSSVQRGSPASFPVTGVIKGWVEALQIMPVGSKWKLFIPADLAYGDRGAGGQIGPNTALIFEVELLGIE